MSTGGNNKVLLYSLLGGAALIGSAIIFHLLTNKESKSSQMFDDIEALGAPKREANGMLSFPYYKDLWFIIQKYSKEAF